MRRRNRIGANRKLVLFVACTVSVATLIVGCSRAKQEVSKAKEGLREGEALLLGMETYAYGFPLVIMDLTRQVMTATPTAGELAHQPVPAASRDRAVEFQERRTDQYEFSVVDELSGSRERALILSIPDTGRHAIAMRVMNIRSCAIVSSEERSTACCRA